MPIDPGVVQWDEPSSRIDTKAIQWDVPASVQAGTAINSVPRQLGLTARYALEGPAQFAQIVTEPVRQYITDPIAGLFGAKPGKPLGQIASSLADKIGLPTPQTANERVVGDASRLVAGGGGLLGAARLASAAPGFAGILGSGLAQAPGQQLASAAGAGLLGGASREAGGSDGMQAAAGFAGSLLGAGAPALGSAIAGAARRVITPSMSNADMDVQIGRLLQSQGVDYSAIAERARQSMRTELRSALQANKEIDPAAVRRLSDFAQTGTIPTRGMVSQDPVQITREQNLAKIAANQNGDELHDLPRMQNQNNAKLISNLNDLGAARGDAFQAGENVINGFRTTDAGKQQAVTGLYDKARAMPGGETPLNRKTFVDNIYNSLAKENKLAYLPDDIANTLNTISTGRITRAGQTFDVPFDAKALDNIMTDIATAQRGTQDGNVKAALGIARKALDRTPIQPIKQEFSGNQLVTQATGDRLRTMDGQAGEFMGALNQARAAARERFAWQESARPIEAALGGAQPDKFVNQFVVGGSLADAQAVAKSGAAPQVRDALIAHLKEKAIGQGATDEVGKFSQSAFNRELAKIGDRKLSLFFPPDELALLKANARAASYMQVQPVGSAVNNSNSGALVLGRGADWISSVAKKIPGGQTFVADPINNINIALSQRSARNIRPGLLTAQPSTNPLLGSILPSIYAGGLLAAPSVPGP